MNDDTRELNRDIDPEVRRLMLGTTAQPSEELVERTLLAVERASMREERRIGWAGTTSIGGVALAVALMGPAGGISLGGIAVTAVLAGVYALGVRFLLEMSVEDAIAPEAGEA